MREVEDECKESLPMCRLRRHRARRADDAQPAARVGKDVRQAQHDAPHGS